jgi:hypothetical protein
MLIVSVGLLMQGGLPYIVAATAYPFYSPGIPPDWATLIWPHIPLWFAPTDLRTVPWFWEGSPEGFGVPWSAWSIPMTAWGTFTLALMAAMYCLGTLLSKDWIEHQRLSFPLTEIPIVVAGEQPQPSLRSSIFGNRVFWLGFTPPALVAVMSWLNRISPSFPNPSVSFQVGRYFSGMPLPWSALEGMRLNLWQGAGEVGFSVIGITYLIPADVSLSLWLFYALYWVQMLAWASFGYAPGGGQAGSGIEPRTFISFQEAGGFIAFSAVIMLQSRQALRGTWRSLVHRETEVSDPLDALTRRAALLGFLTANAFMFWFALRAGMSWWSYLLLMGSFYSVILVASRLVAAAGLMFVHPAFAAQEPLIRTIGAVALGPRSLTVMTYLACNYMWDPMNLAMPQMMNAFKLVRSSRLSGRGFSAGAAAAIVLVIGFGLAGLLAMVHRHGASNLDYDWPFRDWPYWAFTRLDAYLRNPPPASNWLRLAMVVGAATTVLLSLLQARFVWWPVSPVGFLVASGSFMNRLMWPGVLIGWMLSTLIRRYGGLRLYRQLRPVFIGLGLGEFVTDGVLGLVASAFGIGLRA